MNRCDIIIPIYNAYDALVECIDSVIANTDLNKNGLILINDCSSDEMIDFIYPDTILENTEELKCC